MYKSDFMRMMKEFHTHGKFVKCLNPSFIILIPKKVKSLALVDYMPISLISGIYKIISKILSIRLSKVLGSIISEQQSAFIGGRQILDSVVVLNEAMDDIKARKDKCLAYKIDFAKAYDSVEWGYLRIIMERFNYDNKWIKWIMECISSARASILVNGSPTEEFQSEKV